MEVFWNFIFYRVDWGSIAGILALVLSAGLALREFRKSRVQLKVDSAALYVYQISNRPELVFCYIPHIINNSSSEPISISSIALLDKNGEAHFAPRDKCVILGIGGPDSNHASIQFSGFPFHIPPYGSARVDLYIRIDKADYPQTGLPQACVLRNQSVECQNSYLPLSGSEKINLQLRCSTPRKTFDLSVSADKGNEVEMLAQLKNRAQISHFF